MSSRKRTVDPCEDNPLSELMYDRGQTVIFNVRGKLCYTDNKVNVMLMRVICKHIIARLSPLLEDELVSSKVLQRLQSILSSVGVEPDSLYKMTASVESCFRIASLTIPSRFLGSVYFSTEFQTLQFYSKGVFEDDPVDKVTYFDDVSSTKLHRVTVKHYGCEKTIGKVQEKNKRLVEDDESYLLESVQRQDEQCFLHRI